MPHAKFDVDVIRSRFAAIDPKRRPAAIALYQQLVLSSCELLRDGHLPRTVVLAGAHEIGVSRGRYGTSEVSKLVHSLVSIGLAEELKDGSLQLTEWSNHHSSRSAVEHQRELAAERKRRSRGQLGLPGVTGLSQRDDLDESRRDTAVTRARVRARVSATDVDQDLPAGPTPTEDPPRAPHASTNGLPYEKELQVAKLLDAVGTDTDTGTRHVLAAHARKLPLAALVRVTESVQTQNPDDRGAYANSALKSELEHIDDPEPRITR